MMVRKYVVKDMPEAITLIRKDLGKDAVILSTKRISQKKWLGFWRIRRIEVLAATGDGVPVRVSPPQNQTMRVQSTPAVVSASKPSSEPERQETMAQEMPPVAQTAHASVPVVNGGDSAKLEAVYKEISDVKQLLKTSLVASGEDGARHAVFQHLVRQGVDEEQVQVLLKDVSVEALAESRETTQGKPQQKPQQVLKEFVSERILDRLQHLSKSEPISPASRIVALVGPTGVGKTTTIAKLAALHVLGGSRKVGLITTDTFRIAAVEQLRTYANILNVPLQVVYQPAELQAAVDALADCDLILLDTAGRNFRHDRNVLEARTILAAVPVDETYLVLSLTSKPDDLDRIAMAFSELPIDKFLFTKMDETSTYGAILNLLMRYGKPISYMTTGQSVPDDIEVADIGKVIRLIVGGAA